MTHVFDSGLARPQRTLIQQGVINALSPLKRPTGYLLDVVKTGVVVRSYTDEAGIAMLFQEIKRAPTIAVATGDRPFQISGIGGKEALSELEVLVYFVTQHGRNMQVGRQETDVVALADDHADPGLHVIMEHALELLLGTYANVTPSSVKQLKPVHEGELATLPEFTLWTQTYRTTTFSHSGGGRQWRTAQQLLDSIHWRVAKDPEANRPEPAVFSTTVDADTNLQEP